MPPESADPVELVRKLAESYRGIKFGRGVVGKTSHATLAIIGAWAIVIFRLSDNVFLDCALITAGLVSTGIYCWWVHRTHIFATANPGLALMEGAQLLEYQKWEAAIKGQPALKSPPIPDPHNNPSLGQDLAGDSEED
jgi:hypothetical protein